MWHTSIPDTKMFLNLGFYVWISFVVLFQSLPVLPASQPSLTSTTNLLPWNGPSPKTLVAGPSATTSFRRKTSSGAGLMHSSLTIWWGTFINDVTQWGEWGLVFFDVRDINKWRHTMRGRGFGLFWHKYIRSRALEQDKGGRSVKALICEMLLWKVCTTFRVKPGAPWSIRQGVPINLNSTSQSRLTNLALLPIC